MRPIFCAISAADELVGQHPKVLRDPAHRVWFQGFGEYGLDFEIWFFSQLEDALTTRSELFESLYTALAKEGIEIPVPQHEVRMQGEGKPTAG